MTPVCFEEERHGWSSQDVQVRQLQSPNTYIQLQWPQHISKCFKGSIYFIMKSEMPDLVPSQEDSISCYLSIDV